MTPAPRRLLAAKVGKPHGLYGEVYVVPVSDDPHRFDPGARLLTESGDALVVVSMRRHGDRLLVKFAGIDTRDSAVSLRGLLYVTPEDLRDLGDNEFWEHDLAGCKVFLVGATEVVGTVTGIDHGPAQDLLVVDTAAGERSVPMVSEFVVDVDVEEGRVVIDPPEGLLE